MTRTGYVFFSILGILILFGIYFFTIRDTSTLPVQEIATSTQSTSGYTNQAYGFTLDKDNLQATTTFSRSYLAINNWSLLDSIEKNNGDGVVAFIFPGSNTITAAELRIGVSNSNTQLQTCTTIDTDTQSTGTTTINDILFHEFSLGDAGMSHYLEAKIYRTVHNGMCYSLEEVVTGTNGEVYDPKATPPFSKEDAFKQLEKIVKSFRFT